MKPLFVFTLCEVVAALVFLLALVWAVIVGARVAWRQTRCAHDEGANETQACQAICRRCGKNLGFIGTWRKRQGRTS